MKLSTRSRYGTRMMVDLAEHFDEGPIRMGDIAKRQDISVKYLEQLIIPLKKAQLIKSVRGPRGGHMLARPPRKITVGEIVRVLEKGVHLTHCVQAPGTCVRSDDCRTRDIWERATRALYDELESVSLSDLAFGTRRI
jgi:Rrf2 family protein